MYFPYTQAEHNCMWPRDLRIQTHGDPSNLTASVRRAVWSVDKDQPISKAILM